MIKTHNVTGLKYLCITKRKNWKTYKGSGVYWKNHIKTHGDDISTQLLFETNDYEEFVEQCIYYSQLYNVQENEGFANLIPEIGYGDDYCNLVIWWSLASNEEKERIYELRSSSMKSYWESLSEDEYKKRTKGCSEAGKIAWESLSDEWKDSFFEMTRAGFKSWVERRDASFDRWRNSISSTMKDYHRDMSVESRLKRGEKISKTKLNRTEKELTNWRQRVLSTRGKKDYSELWSRYSKERVGEGNPASKVIVWYGDRYTKCEFQKRFGKPDTKRNQRIFQERDDCYKDYEDIPKDYGSLTCPHCGSVKPKERKPSGFKRWHFDNCKHKV